MWANISKHILQLVFTFFYAFLTCFISLRLLLFSCHFCEPQEGREVPLFNLFHKDSDTLYIEFFTVRNSDIYKVQNLAVSRPNHHRLDIEERNLLGCCEICPIKGKNPQINM